MMVGVVCGLASEAKAVRRAFASVEGMPPHTVAVSGANAQQAQRAAQRLIHDGADVLFSMGLCGGLDPALKTADVVSATAVLSDLDGPDETKQWDCADVPGGTGADWHFATVLAVDRAMTTVADKAAAFSSTGAAAVDMESHAVMRVATRAGRPAGVLRVVVDDATTALPHFVGELTAPSGHPRLLKLAGLLARHPSEFPSFLALARASASAHSALRAAATRLAQGLRDGD